MKKLTLSVEQRVHLLAICEILFPEYKYIFLDEADIVHPGFVSFYKRKTFGIHWNGETIHWFELCVRHIPGRFPELDLETLLFVKDHPVDHIYKKLTEKP